MDGEIIICSPSGFRVFFVFVGEIDRPEARLPNADRGGDESSVRQHIECWPDLSAAVDFGIRIIFRSSRSPYHRRRPWNSIADHMRVTAVGVHGPESILIPEEYGLLF